MIPLGIVRNPKSRRNRDRPAVDGASLGSHVILREPRSHAELDAVAAEFAARDVGMLGIDGGDGTVRDVLSAMENAFGTLPPVAFLASGKTNILAGSSGTWGTGRRALERLSAAALASPPTLRRARVPTLVVSTDGQRLTGFVFGAGAYAKAIALSDQGLADRIGFGPARVAAGISRGVMALAKGETRGRWLGGTPMRVSLDGRGGAVAGPHPPRLIFMATTLRRFTLGVWPFWDHDGRPLRFLDVDAPPPRFMAALLPTLSGRPAPWMRAAGYRSGGAARIELRLHEPFVLDGEAYEPGPDGLVAIEAGTPVEFVAP